jgi:hypothetical protein
VDGYFLELGRVEKGEDGSKAKCKLTIVEGEVLRVLRECAGSVRAVPRKVELRAVGGGVDSCCF